MNPFGNQNTNHITWPMFVWMYNLPPWKCMKTKYIHMSMLIEGLNNREIELTCIWGFCKRS